MEFDNTFNVPLPPDQAWNTLMNIERIAPCVPGAELTEIIDDKNFKGKVSVRLGPVALTFQGSASFEETDEQNHSATVKAQGADAKGRGGANANVGFRLEPANGGTTVKIHTNLQLSGSVAQYGRGVGMIQDLASQIIGQFAENLAAQIEEKLPAGDGNLPDDTSTTVQNAEQPVPPTPPANVGGIALRVLWNQVVRSIKNLFGIKP